MKTLMSNPVYDLGKWVAQIFLPAVGSLYFTLAQLWSLPNAEQVVGTITAVDLFLGLLLGLSTKQYNNSEDRFAGAVNIMPGGEEGSNDLHFNLNPNKLQGNKQIVLKVNDQT